MVFSFAKYILAGSICAALTACQTIPDAEQSTRLAETQTVKAGYGFIAVGDTGYVSDKSGLNLVAGAVKNYCASQTCDFAVMAGDNIYQVGAAGDDGDAELFQSRFIKPYGPLSEIGSDFRIYTALGNHDWYTSRVGALAQVKFHETTPPFYMDGFFYSVRPPAMNGDLELFVIDTEMLLAPQTIPSYDEAESGEMVATGKTRAGGHKNAMPVTEQEKAQLSWFTQALEKSTAKWKIVLAHHPLWQSRADSKYAQSIRLRELLLPSLCRYADAYVAGHQHTLELHTDDCGDSNAAPLVHIVSGAGAKARKIDPEFAAWQQKKYPQLGYKWAAGDEFGFSHIGIEGNQLDVQMLTVSPDGKTKPAFRQGFVNRP
ncbi:metallophosphoesterase [Sphingorhabdus sp. Alg239-R122]|uniref:metallophosphoesterase n=1 Tax=Sphingorhabdus sp. Alg239-R122 TaxID=2305989 RepID=UPI0013DA5595|nr:metallophosphoesterase [Sphingorhabdus sp. Alg239-R122]